jgi:hypothetical protein
MQEKDNTTKKGTRQQLPDKTTARTTIPRQKREEAKTSKQQQENNRTRKEQEMCARFELGAAGLRGRHQIGHALHQPLGD